MLQYGMIGKDYDHGIDQIGMKFFQGEDDH